MREFRNSNLLWITKWPKCYFLSLSKDNILAISLFTVSYSIRNLSPFPHVFYTGSTTEYRIKSVRCYPSTPKESLRVRGFWPDAHPQLAPHREVKCEIQPRSAGDDTRVTCCDFGTVPIIIGTVFYYQETPGEGPHFTVDYGCVTPEPGDEWIPERSRV